MPRLPATVVVAFAAAASSFTGGWAEVSAAALGGLRTGGGGGGGGGSSDSNAASAAHHVLLVLRRDSSAEEQERSLRLWAAVQRRLSELGADPPCREGGGGGGGGGGEAAADGAVCSPLSDVQPAALRWRTATVAADARLDLSGEVPGLPRGTPSEDEVADEVAAAFRSGGGGGGGEAAAACIVTLRTKTPADHLQCILPDTHRVSVDHGVRALRGSDGDEEDEGASVAAAAEWVASRFGMVVDPVYRAYHRSLMEELHWPLPAAEEAAAAEGNVCEVVDASALDEKVFRAEFVQRSRPVIVRGGAAHVGCGGWSLPYVLSKAGTRDVHVKIAPDGVFEGPEELARWGGTEEEEGDGGRVREDDTPEYVLRRLQSPDRVIARPASTTMTVGELAAELELGEARDAGVEAGEEACRAEEAKKKKGRATASFYLEYASLSGLRELAGDIRVPRWASFLRTELRNIWLGGRTLGKMHFDPYDNLMAVVEGRKVFTLLHPHRNERAYEGHVREATLRYNRTSGRFSRADLPEATAMVMTPVHANDPSELERYPLFGRLNATRVTCSVGPGDVLYVPAFWWHEVASEGAHTLAANLWFRPFYEKVFPCKTCRLRHNQKEYPFAM